MIVLKALLTGLVVGVITTRVRLPLPAPPSLAGVMGIVGIYLGYVITNYFMKGGF